MPLRSLTILRMVSLFGSPAAKRMVKKRPSTGSKRCKPVEPPTHRVPSGALYKVVTCSSRDMPGALRRSNRRELPSRVSYSFRPPLVASHSLPLPASATARTFLSASAPTSPGARAMREKPPLPRSTRLTPLYQEPTQKVPARSRYSDDSWLSATLNLSPVWCRYCRKVSLAGSQRNRPSALLPSQTVASTSWYRLATRMAEKPCFSLRRTRACGGWPAPPRRQRSAPAMVPIHRFCWRSTSSDWITLYFEPGAVSTAKCSKRSLPGASMSRPVTVPIHRRCCASSASALISLSPRLCGLPSSWCQVRKWPVAGSKCCKPSEVAIQKPRAPSSRMAWICRLPLPRLLFSAGT